MRKMLFSLLFTGISLFANAQSIEVNGLQSGVWAADTVVVTGDVTVQDSLIISAGTTVLFDGFYHIEAKKNAFIKAMGTESDSIVFTVADTTKFHVFNSGRGGWNGIRLAKAEASRFDYCRFQYGKAALDNDQDGGALRIVECDNVEITHSTLFCNFSREHGGALSAVDSKVVMHDCDVYNNLTYTEIDTVYFMYGGAMHFLKCEVELVDMNFRYNSGATAIGGALSLDSCAVKIDRCKFEYNYGINGGGLYLIRSNDWDCSISNSLFANNVSGHFGGGLAISDSSPLVSNLTVVNNRSIGVNCGGIFFYQYSSPILRNCIVYGNTNDASLEEPVQMWAWTFDDYKPEFHNCMVQYGFENISNNEVIEVYENCLDADPLFRDAENDDFHLTESSPCINAGLTYPDDLNAFDLDMNGRLKGDIIDIGAYEYTATGIGEIAQNESIMRIVGNPITTESYAEIELERAGDLTASICSMDGKILGNKQFRNLQTGLNRLEMGEMFQNLPNGTYLFIIKTSGKIVAAKAVSCGF